MSMHSMNMYRVADVSAEDNHGRGCAMRRSDEQSGCNRPGIIVYVRRSCPSRGIRPGGVRVDGVDQGERRAGSNGFGGLAERNKV